MTIFATSDAIDASTVATGTAAATLAINVARVFLVNINNGGNVALEVFVDRDEAPSGAGGADLVIPANTNITFDLRSVGRSLTGQVYARYKSAATGSLIINITR